MARFTFSNKLVFLIERAQIMNELFFYNHNFINAAINLNEHSSHTISIQVHKPTQYDVTKVGKYHSVTLHIDIERFDELALAWCKKRGISNVTSALKSEE